MSQHSGDERDNIDDGSIPVWISTDSSTFPDQEKSPWHQYSYYPPGSLSNDQLALFKQRTDRDLSSSSESYPAGWFHPEHFDFIWKLKKVSAVCGENWLPTLLDTDEKFRSATFVVVVPTDEVQENYKPASLSPQRSKKNKGWSEEEDQVFLLLVKDQLALRNQKPSLSLYGRKMWANIFDQLEKKKVEPPRTMNACKIHWSKNERKMFNLDVRKPKSESSSLTTSVHGK
ncbi:hypothetical protein GLAREA_03468 [Glarea lozoyensis ATCC 20868]|uniref:Myb-like domain-containing protein n=1 Tax=Glarea lozoyensis (strain ATCC 20868 / MF5171) TaxID=1116229 RepID=S3DET9_GLAL2|nr:uncharacterized protein GLAREA_03468 [Glarea lozoyensis ATCC 20868]EPE30501.1 hypothetical protein GLAREA_03468 [Glarea lozoyensis ATCC 20868]